MSAVDVLLATYNGESHLPALLASLDAQTHRGIRVVLRDDGSRDGTQALLADWAQSTSHECLIVEDDHAGLGAKGNFARLLEASDRPYFMCCDQDDVWRPDKVEASLAGLRSAEAELGADTPLLVHCDLEVVAENLDPIAPSFWAQQNLGFSEVRRGAVGDQARRDLLVRNVVTGCALIGNDPLRRLALPLPHDSAMHDWWLALVAAYLGEIRAIDEPLIQYRQHGANSLGAKDWSGLGVFRRAMTGPGAAVERTRSWIRLAQKQAGELAARFQDDPTVNGEGAVLEFSGLRKAPLVRRKTFMSRHGISMQSRFHSIVTWMAL